MHSKFLRWLSFLGLLAVVAFDAAAQTPPAAAAAAAAPAPGSQMAPGRIKATRVTGTVTIEDKNTKVVAPLAEGQEITQGYIVHTADNSSVVLIFSSGASISLAHTSDLDIETFLQDPFSTNYEPAKETQEPSVSNTSIKLTRGELVGNVKKLRNAGQPGGSTFKVGTPVGAAGIRGTTFRIVYRPTGNGQAFNFVLTTVEGAVEVQLASGTVTAPPAVVTQNTEVVINNVTVDTTTNTISVQTSTGATATVVTAAPPPTTAAVADVQVVQAAAQQIAQAVATTVFTPPPPPPPTTTTQGTGTQTNNSTDNSNQNNSNQNNQNQNNQNSNSQNNTQNSNTQNSNQNNITNTPPSSPGGTTQTPQLTPGAGRGP